MGSSSTTAISSDGGGTLAVVAALPEEVTPLWRRLGDRTAARVGSGKARSGVLSGRPVVVMATGDGATRARQGLAGLIGRFPLRGVIAIGIAGGLSPDLEVGTVVAAHAVLSEAGEAGGPDPELLAATRNIPGLGPGIVYSHSEVAVDPVAKERLWKAGGQRPRMVVDLESASYADESARCGIPYAVLRAVSDGYDEALPLDFNRFRRQDGSSDRWRVLRHTLLHPSIVPELLQLRERLRVCAGRLAECVEAMLRR